MSLYQHELHQSRSMTLIWALSMAALNIICLLLFPEMKKQVSSLNEVFSSLGAFSTAFGMDQLSIATLPGFFSIECGNILGIGGGLFAAWLGTVMITREETSHTADFLYGHPISRTAIVLDKLAALITQILLLNLIVFAADLSGMAIIGESIPWKEVCLIHLAYLLLMLEIGLLCFSLSSLRCSSSMGLCLGLTMILYFLNLAANLNDGLQWLRWITPYAWCEGSWIIRHGSLDWSYVCSGIGISLLAALCCLQVFSRRDLAS